MRSASTSQQRADERQALCLRQHAVSEPQEFRLQIGIAHRPLHAADRVLDELVEAPAVLHDDRGADLLLLQRRVDRRRHPIAQGDDGLVGGVRVAEIAHAGRTDDDCESGGEVDAELALEPGCGCLLAGQFQHERMHAKIDALDRVCREPVLVAQLNAGVDGRVNDDATRERFVGVQRDLVASAEIGRDLPVLRDVLSTLAHPLLPSRPDSVLVKPRDARRAAVSPFCAARPG